MLTVVTSEAGMGVRDCSHSSPYIVVLRKEKDGAIKDKISTLSVDFIFFTSMFSVETNTTGIRKNKYTKMSITDTSLPFSPWKQGSSV